VCSATSPCRARPRWCTGVPNQAAVRISSPSSSHVSSRPVMAALRLVLPHAVLATGDDRTVEPAALLGMHTGPSLPLFPASGKATLPHGWSAKRTSRRHCSNRSAAPIAVPEDLRLVVQDKGLSVRGSAIFMPRQPPCDVEAGRIGPEHEHRPRPGRRGRSGRDRAGRTESSGARSLGGV
jgi:hypothetical protein